MSVQHLIKPWTVEHCLCCSHHDMRHVATVLNHIQNKTGRGTEEKGREEGEEDEESEERRVRNEIIKEVIKRHAEDGF